MLQPPLTDCVFCRIVAGEHAAEVVWRSDASIAFLDIRPVFPGHTLVVPPEHVVTLADLPAPDIGPFFTDVQRLAVAVQAALEADGSFVAINNVVSQSVPHLHAHVVPRRRKDGLRGFFWPRQKYESDDAMAEVAESIRSALES